MERGEATFTGGEKDNNCFILDEDREKIVEAVKKVQENLGELDYKSCPETFELIRSLRTTTPEYIAGWCKYGKGCISSSKDCPIGLGKKEE